jgi:hypothetical protein
MFEHRLRSLPLCRMAMLLLVLAKQLPERVASYFLRYSPLSPAASPVPSKQSDVRAEYRPFVTRDAAAWAPSIE